MPIIEDDKAQVTPYADEDFSAPEDISQTKVQIRGDIENVLAGSKDSIGLAYMPYLIEKPLLEEEKHIENKPSTWEEKLKELKDMDEERLRLRLETILPWTTGKSKKTALGRQYRDGDGWTKENLAYLYAEGTKILAIKKAENALPKNAISLDDLNHLSLWTLRTMQRQKLKTTLDQLEAAVKAGHENYNKLLEQAKLLYGGEMARKESVKQKRINVLEKEITPLKKKLEKYLSELHSRVLIEAQLNIIESETLKVKADYSENEQIRTLADHVLKVVFLGHNKLKTFEDLVANAGTDTYKNTMYEIKAVMDSGKIPEGVEDGRTIEDYISLYHAVEEAVSNVSQLDSVRLTQRPTPDDIKTRASDILKIEQRRSRRRAIKSVAQLASSEADKLSKDEKRFFNKFPGWVVPEDFVFLNDKLNELRRINEQVVAPANNRDRIETEKRGIWKILNQVLQKQTNIVMSKEEIERAESDIKRNIDENSILNQQDKIYFHGQLLKLVDLMKWKLNEFNRIMNFDEDKYKIALDALSRMSLNDPIPEGTPELGMMKDYESIWIKLKTVRPVKALKTIGPQTVTISSKPSLDSTPAVIPSPIVPPAATSSPVRRPDTRDSEVTARVRSEMGQYIELFNDERGRDELRKARSEARKNRTICKDWTDQEFEEALAAMEEEAKRLIMNRRLKAVIVDDMGELFGSEIKAKLAILFAILDLNPRAKERRRTQIKLREFAEQVLYKAIPEAVVNNVIIDLDNLKRSGSQKLDEGQLVYIESKPDMISEVDDIDRVKTIFNDRLRVYIEAAITQYANLVEDESALEGTGLEAEVLNSKDTIPVLEKRPFQALESLVQGNHLEVLRKVQTALKIDPEPYPGLRILQSKVNRILTKIEAENDKAGLELALIDHNDQETSLVEGLLGFVENHIN